MAIPSTVDRVPEHTAPKVNERIRRKGFESIRTHARAGSEAIRQRIAELDREWDIERAIEANAATAVLVGLGLGVFLDRRWLALPAAVGVFLMQHAVQGWCPPVPVLRRLGFRTAREIEIERNALKALVGDYTEAGLGSVEALGAAAR